MKENKVDLYYTRYQNHYKDSYETLEEAKYELIEQFYGGYSCSQAIVDESTKTIYSLPTLLEDYTEKQRSDFRDNFLENGHKIEDYTLEAFEND